MFSLKVFKNYFLENSIVSKCLFEKIITIFFSIFQSKERAELYRHLGEAHGNYGGGWQIQGNQVLQVEK